MSLINGIEGAFERVADGYVGLLDEVVEFVATFLSLELTDTTYSVLRILLSVIALRILHDMVHEKTFKKILNIALVITSLLLMNRLL